MLSLLNLLMLSPSEPFKHALPRRPIPILLFLMMLSLLALSTGTSIAGIWAIVRLIGWLLDSA